MAMPRNHNAEKQERLAAAFSSMGDVVPIPCDNCNVTTTTIGTTVVQRTLVVSER